MAATKGGKKSEDPVDSSEIIRIYKSPLAAILFFPILKGL